MLFLLLLLFLGAVRKFSRLFDDVKVFLLSDISLNYTRNFTCYAKPEKAMSRAFHFGKRGSCAHGSWAPGGKIQTLSLTIQKGCAHKIVKFSPRHSKVSRSMLGGGEISFARDDSAASMLRRTKGEWKKERKSSAERLLEFACFRLIKRRNDCGARCVIGENLWLLSSAHFPCKRWEKQRKSTSSRRGDATIRVHAAYASLVEQKSHADAKKKFTIDAERRATPASRVSDRSLCHPKRIRRSVRAEKTRRPSATTKRGKKLNRSRAKASIDENNVFVKRN